MLKKLIYMLVLIILSFYVFSCKKQKVSKVYAIAIVGEYGQNYQKNFIYEKIRDYIRKYELTNKYKVFILSSLENCNCNKFEKVIVIEPKRIEVKENMFRNRLYCVDVVASPIVGLKVLENGKIRYKGFETISIKREKCNDYSYPEVNVDMLKKKSLDKISEILIKKIFC